MSRIVLDASAFIASLKDEPGAEIVADAAEPLMSAVNAAECVGFLVRLGSTPRDACASLDIAGLEIIPFDRDLAEIAGALIERTRHAGLSLGDRACLALGLREKLPVLTADRSWAKVDVGVEIRMLR